MRFLASEYSTGKTHGGRIDTLGIDENNSPVIIEYKRSTNENVINQGLFYLDWLLDHRAEFTLLAMKKLGAEVAEQIDWSSPRLHLHRRRLHEVRRACGPADQAQHRADPLPPLRRRLPACSNSSTPTTAPRPERGLARTEAGKQAAVQDRHRVLRPGPAELRRPLRALEAYLHGARRRRPAEDAEALLRLPAHQELRLRRGPSASQKLLVFVKVDPRHRAAGAGLHARRARTSATSVPATSRSLSIRGRPGEGEAAARGATRRADDASDCGV